MSNELTVDDFRLDGQYGSQGSRMEQVGINHFRMILGHAPNQPNWFNKPQFEIKRHARGNKLRLDIVTPSVGKEEFPITEYHFSWSCDNEHWQPIRLQTDDAGQHCFIFPEFTEDHIYFGHQVPLSYEKMVQLIEQWRSDSRVTVHEVGQSLNGRTLYRLTVTDPGTAYSRDRRWGHYALNTHPGEHNAQWRIVGMIEWLLQDPQAASFLQRSICHFVIIMSVDGPSNGWYRVNQQGVDMNRSYSPEGSDAVSQAHEAFVFQQDLERIMASSEPIATIWNMHTWGGIVEPIIYVGPEFGSSLGDWTEFRDMMIHNDTYGYIKPLKSSMERKDKNPIGLLSGWNGGPRQQFGITGVLCEGGGGLDTKEANMESGKTIMRSIAEFYSGLRPAMNEAGKG
ncbi:MAG: hypothetical protein K0Q59_4745 [Paenibacillus sp.]|nr:hypothetical protein [Paenibacillus sp.]